MLFGERYILYRSQYLSESVYQYDVYKRKVNAEVGLFVAYCFRRILCLVGIFQRSVFSVWELEA